MCRKHGGRWPATRLWERFSGFQSSHGKRRTTQRRRARRRLAARRSFALTSVKAVGQSLRVLLLDVPLSSSTEELEGQTAEKAEKRQTQYQRYVARFCLNSALVSRGEPRRPRFQIRNLLRTERSLCLSLLFKGFFSSLHCVSLSSDCILQRLEASSTYYKADSFFILSFPPR